ncbi:MAG: cadherin-like domain-containing protein, partial [Hyphomicrobiales bacterium]
MSINLGTLAEDGTRVISKAQLLSGFPELGQPASIVSFFIQTGAGSLSSNGNGSWTYTAALNDDSAVEFAVTATNGSTTLSTTADLDLIPVNDAPVLTPISPHLTTITEDDAGNPGQTIASIIGSSITDPDGPDVPKGIAVIGAQSANGHWEYSLDGGEAWTAFGSYSTSSALLLDQTSMVRFVPDGISGGSSTFTYVAWDETVTFGTTTDVVPGGGITPYSIQSDTAHISVLDVNDAPVLSNVPAEISYTELATPKTLAPSLALVDVDNPTLVSATVKITDGLTAGDVLSVGGLTSGTDGDVTWSFDANSGVLSFSGEAATATYAALLA